MKYTEKYTGTISSADAVRGCNKAWNDAVTENVAAKADYYAAVAARDDAWAKYYAETLADYLAAPDAANAAPADWAKHCDTARADYDAAAAAASIACERYRIAKLNIENDNRGDGE